VSEETVRAIWNAGAEASPVATRDCVPGWLDDFSQDIERIDVPTLILHGTADRILSIDGQGRRLHAALPDARYVEIEGGPHVMCVTHAEEVNRELLSFLREPAQVTAGG
jgi:non-heme chloroperoxidase